MSERFEIYKVYKWVYINTLYINTFLFLYLIEHTDPPKCTNCNQLLSVRRILTECTSYDQIRHQDYSFSDIKNLQSHTWPKIYKISFLKVNLYN